MPIETFPIGPLETNCHIVISGSDAVAVDPGGDLNSGLGEVLALLKEQNLTLRAILCTHFHFDHLYGVAALHEATGAPVYGRDFHIIIDYAHTPDGLKNILSTFRECEKNRLIAVFGCGGDRDKTKRPIMGSIAEHFADYVIVTSDNPRSEDPRAIIDDILVGMRDSRTPYKVIENRIEAIKYAVSVAQPGDIIVLAGKGHETYQILKDGTIHLDEREVVAEALKNLK